MESKVLLLLGACVVIAEANIYRGLRCEGKYPVGTHWQRVQGLAVYLCTCTAHQNGAFAHCKPTGTPRPSTGGAKCRGGHRPGDTWADRYQSRLYKCTCTGDAYRAVTKCQLVQQPVLKCQGYFTAGQEWTINLVGKTLKCRCVVNEDHTTAETKCQEAVPERIQYEPKCQDRYRHGQQWTRYRDQLPYICTCTVKEYQAHTKCKPDACRVDGHVYRAGRTFHVNKYGIRYLCTCTRTSTGTQYSCNQD